MSYLLKAVQWCYCVVNWPCHDNCLFTLGGSVIWIAIKAYTSPIARTLFHSLNLFHMIVLSHKKKAFGKFLVNYWQLCIYYYCIWLCHDYFLKCPINSCRQNNINAIALLWQLTELSGTRGQNAITVFKAC